MNTKNATHIREVLLFTILQTARLLRKLDRRYSSQFMKTQVCHGFLSRRPGMMLCRRPAISAAQIHIYASWTTTWPLLYGNHNSVVTLNNPKILPQRLHYRLYSKPDLPLNCECTTSHHILSGLGNWRYSERRYLMRYVSSSGSSNSNNSFTYHINQKMEKTA